MTGQISIPEKEGIDDFKLTERQHRHAQALHSTFLDVNMRKLFPRVALGSAVSSLGIVDVDHPLATNP